MAFPDDLLEQAEFLANRNPESDANLRRAISTAYYALFHLLVADASENWSQAGQRPTFARLFKHGEMKQASEAAKRANKSAQLYKVADAFISAQGMRHEADYNNAEAWTRSDVLGHIRDVSEAFRNWDAIRRTPEAQDYLFSLLGSPKGR